MVAEFSIYPLACQANRGCAIAPLIDSLDEFIKDETH